jgi:succinylarginine dihydrolase
VGALRRLGFRGTDADVLRAAAGADEPLFRAACSASSMWAANAATVIAAADAGDGRVHLVTANLATMLHRALEAESTHEVLRQVFANDRYFCVHPPLPYAGQFSDEGAANHMRLAPHHGAPGLNLFVHGEGRRGRFPERQSRRASEAVARLAQAPEERTLFIRQSLAAVEAGAFHNDVVAVANEDVLLTHPEAFEDKSAVYAAIAARAPQAQIVETGGISLAEAVESYLFNSQLVTLPGGGMTLIAPAEVREHARVWAAVQDVLAACRRIERVEVVDVRESMRNGGGPACLRLRVPVAAEAAAAIAPGYLLTPERVEALGELIERFWPESIAPADLLEPDLWAAAEAAHEALCAFTHVPEHRPERTFA